MREVAFEAGAMAFDKGYGEPPYEFGSEGYRAWWRGWEARAEAYLLDEFEKAASHDQ